MNQRPSHRLAAFVFLLTFAYHATSPVSQQGDSRWTVFTAVSLLREGNLDLNEYPQREQEWNFYAIECVSDAGRRYPITSLTQCPNGRLYNFYPIAISLLAAPTVAVQLVTLHVLHPLLSPIASRITHPVLQSYLNGTFQTGSPLFEIVSASCTIPKSFLIGRYIADIPWPTAE